MVRSTPHTPTAQSVNPSQSYGGGGYGGGGYGGGYGGGGGGGGGWGGEDKMHSLGGSLRTVDWASFKLERFEKNFYVEDKRVTARSDREIEEFRKAKEMKVRRFTLNFSPRLTLRQVQGRTIPRPVTSFDEIGFPEYIMSTIRAQGFPAPTPIQCQAWPMALSGHDVVAIAQTGSGKTISFALPAMLHINACVFRVPQPVRALNDMPIDNPFLHLGTGQLR